MKSNDHRQIANRMALFHQQPEGPGMTFWHPRGFAIYQTIEAYIRRKMRRAGFHEVRTPQMLARSFWEASGHWAKFSENMFAFGDGNQVFALKPMSCPGHIQIFNKGQRSFRDLPFRLSEFGFCHRDEPSGALHGLMRGRAFTQDDAHIFCLESQIEEEVVNFCKLLKVIYADFGFNEIQVDFATRPELRAGSDAIWDRAESALRAAANSAGIEFEIDPGEGAFYGPKLDFSLRDNQDRIWQCGTVQLDFVLPEKLNANFDGPNGDKCRPVMIHHAVLGSVERFIGMLLEHYDGNLPLWLAPDQIAVASISDDQAAYVNRVVDKLAGMDFRVVADNRSESLPKKVVDARQAGIPILMVAGGREAVSNTISLRQWNGKQHVLDVDAAMENLRPKAFK